jgi:hypothetical protein
MSLEKLGISTVFLTIYLTMLAIVLILLFIFIFLGIKSFAIAGTFGAIINSIIPVAAATGVSST